ncbi:MAG: 5/3-nucleotidase [Miltoncostaeaceae bacterium]|jgi:5'-nucleotidase|nr:5/3-nucleotidase [Miltoncostaeaceae bacterium]
MTHILVTNDDGVDSPGLLALKQALEPHGKVSVIAPNRNRSAIGRGITIHNPLHVEEVRLADGSEALATDGTPVDCVRFAALGLLGDQPDLIVSGINLGLNLGDDVTYSGTVAAAFEGIMLGLPAIAVSCHAVDERMDQWDGMAYDFRAVAGFAARLVPVVQRDGFPKRMLLNVNGPGLPPERVTGARVTRLGRRIYDDQLMLEATDGPRRRYTIYGGNPSFQREEGTDFAAVERGEISITPLHFDLTDIDGIGALERLSLADLLEEHAAVDTPAA